MSVAAIYSAIKDSEFGDARSLIAKELQKNPTNSVYLGLRALLNFEQNNRQNALSDIEQIHKNNNVTSATLDRLVAPVLLSYQESSLLCSFFEQINRRQPADIDNIETWMRDMMILGDTPGLSKALSAANRAYSSRVNTFRAAFSLCMVHNNLDPSTLEYKLYPQLALRMMEKENALPVTSPQEAFAYASVLEMSSPQRMVEFSLSDTQTPFQSLDLRVKTLDALVKTENWSVLFDVCQGRLSAIDSYNYWQALNTAGVELGKVSEVRAFASKFRGLNVRLAMIDLAEKSGGDVMAEFKNFWDSLGAKPAVFDYLRPYFAHAELLNYALSNSPNFSTTVNVEKIKYATDNPSNVEKLVALYNEHIGELPTEKTDYFAGTDLLLMAAHQMLADKSDKYRYEKAAVILEHASYNDPASFNVRLLLIKIYRIIGAFAKAQSHFYKLSIKEMQYETIGHIMFTRLCSLSPTKKISDAIRFYASADMSQFTEGAMANGIYSQLSGMMELQYKLNTSVNRRLVVLEWLRCLRIFRETADPSLVLKAPLVFSDNRDFATQFDPKKELAGRDILGLETGPRQYAEYVLAQTDKEQAYLAAMRATTEHELQQKQTLSDTARTQHTEAEAWNYEVVMGLNRSGLVISPLSLPETISWEYFHTAYTMLETFHVVESFAQKHHLKAPQAIQDMRDAIEEATRDHLDSQHSYLQKVRASVGPWADELGLAHGKTLEGIANERTKSLTNLLGVI